MLQEIASYYIKSEINKLKEIKIEGCQENNHFIILY